MTETKERPIIFSSEMVRAILEGRKTQTRRVVNPQPDPLCRDPFPLLGDYGVEFCGCGRGARRNPFGNPGGLLWVREAWRWDRIKNDVHYRADDGCHRFLTPEANEWSDKDWHEKRHRHAQWNARWRPSIHMPRWASRITLRVADVRVERLQGISDADVAAEGFEVNPSLDMERIGTRLGAREASTIHPISLGGGVSRRGPRQKFADLWDKINDKPGRRWGDDPFVWVISFELVKATDRSLTKN